ncbi:hypothetical protein V6Z11_D05G330800, partial [Gossypium hirsutum]
DKGVHFGHGAKKWNSRMVPYISAKRKGIHITNLTRTARFLLEACDLVFDVASKGKQFLIVGTKNKAANSMGGLNCLLKRDATMLKRQLSRLQTYLGGIKYMMRLPNIVIIVDQQEEYTTLREFITLGIPTICLIDTNSDPNLVDILIPTNDDATTSIRLILNKLAVAICEGCSNYI